MTRFQLVRILLGLIGIGLMVATLPIFFPAWLMADCHRWLGLGEFPNQPITLYLARSTSLLYAIHGFVMTYVAVTFQRNWHWAPVLGWIHLVAGLMMLGIDSAAPMPLYWIVGEGPGVAAMGAVLIWLSRGIQPSQSP